MKVLFAGAAKADIAELDASISKENPARALRIVRSLQEACYGLSDMRRRFQFVPGMEYLGIRRRVVDDYLIFYRIGDAAVQVLRVLRGATEYEIQLWGEE